MTYIISTLNQLVNKRVYNKSNIMEIAEFTSLAVIAVLVPLLLRHPQPLVGIVVNFMLVMAAISVDGWKKIIPLIIFPSISASVGGYLFGPFTIFLVYLIPFIWIGNILLVFTFKFLYVLKGKNYAVTLLIAGALKSGFLFLMAMLLINLSVIPPIFAKAMGIMQLITTMIGGLAAFPVMLIYHKYFPVIENEK